MPPSAVWVVVIVVLADLVFVPLVLYALVRGAWSPLVERYPAREPAADAVEKQFQSYKIGLFNLGFMIHTAVDDACLHLRPAKLGRMLGMKPVSIPWEEITPIRRRGKNYAEVKIGTDTMLGPRWALELAFADHPEDTPPDSEPGD